MKSRTNKHSQNEPSASSKTNFFRKEDNQIQDFFTKSPLNPFFNSGAQIQTKLTIGQPNDKYEQEADAMADHVLNKSENPGIIIDQTPEIQSKCAECEEEEEVQAKFEINRKQEEEEELQMQPLEEEEEELQMQPLEEEEEELQMQPLEEEEEELQMQSEEEEEELQMKANNVQKTIATSSFESKLNATSKGQPLPKNIRQEMEVGFGADFSQVNIHQDTEAENLSSAINAQAFTHGNDIYFNKAKYNPGTTSGKHLLAHELTHTIQQNGESIQKVDDPKVSTPIPASATKNKSSGVHNLTINDVKVEIHPDVFVKGKSGGETEFKMIPKSWTYDGYDTNSDGTIAKVKNAPKVPKVVIKTTYGLTVKPSGTSAYGRGTTAADKKAGNTSLRFHEGSHGTDFIKYLTDNPFPKFPNGVGMTVADFKKAVEKYKKERGEYGQKMQKFTDTRTECVGYTIDQYHKDNAKPGETFPIVCGP